MSSFGKLLEQRRANEEVCQQEQVRQQREQEAKEALAHQLAEAFETERLKDGTVLEDLFGEETDYVRDFVSLLESRGRFRGCNLDVVLNRTLVTPGYFGRLLGLTPYTEYETERTQGYKIGRRVPDTAGYNHPAEAIVYLCKDGVLRESYEGLGHSLPNPYFGAPEGNDSLSTEHTKVKPLQRGHLEVGRYVMVGQSYQDPDTREFTAYPISEFQEVPILELLLEIADREIQK